jgi:hypothetical protein
MKEKSLQPGRMFFQVVGFKPFEGPHIFLYAMSG